MGIIPESKKPLQVSLPKSTIQFTLDPKDRSPMILLVELKLRSNTGEQFVLIPAFNRSRAIAVALLYAIFFALSGFLA